MYELNKNGKVFTSKFVGTGPSCYEKRIYRAAVSQRLRNTALHYCSRVYVLKLNSKVHWLARQSILRIHINNSFPKW